MGLARLLPPPPPAVAVLSCTDRPLPLLLPVINQVRGLSIAENPTLRNVLGKTLLVLAATLLLNGLILWAAWSAFIAPLERAAENLRASRKVDLTEIASVKMYARFTCQILGAVVASTLLLLLITNQITAGALRYRTGTEGGVELMGAATAWRGVAGMKESLLESAKGESGVTVSVRRDRPPALALALAL
jgi:hypothetical protein